MSIPDSTIPLNERGNEDARALSVVLLLEGAACVRGSFVETGAALPQL